MTLLVALLSALAATARAASAASVTGASFSGGAGTASIGGTLYAKQGANLTLTLTTDSDTTCVRVTDGTTTVDKDAASAKTSWTFTSADSIALFQAGSGNGTKTVTTSAYKSSNGQHHCTGNAGESGNPNASYVLDNSGPAVNAAVSPAANAAGWNNSDTSITWSATDAGSGVASGPTPATDSVTGDTAGVTKTSAATDRVGNTGSGSVTVKLDKTKPTITGSQSPAANVNGWNNTNVTVSFSCSDVLSGIKSCSSPTTLTTESALGSVTGSAVDNADNSNSATVAPVKIDKTSPTLSGAPTTSPNGAGWYKGDVTIHWTAADLPFGGSGLAGTPSDSTITGEGTGLTASAGVSDLAGNSTSATSAAVKIDRTAPNTTATAPANWNNTDVTVSLNPSDALSGVAQTFYALDGGSPQSGTSVSISSEGLHTLDYWSVDNAGNVEAEKTVQVKIDKTPPTINHTSAPAPNANGWNNGSVTVSFSCSDALSGIATCTSAHTVATEGKDQAVTGTATDNAGNSATDPAKVSIDETAPTISAALGSTANAAGWFNQDVLVQFTCADALSGIDLCDPDLTLHEGAGQSASGNARDAAGNTASAGVSGVNVDKTAPTLSGAPTTLPNSNGWYSGDVTVHWTATDTLSGLDPSTVPGDSVVTGEGAALTASGSVSDRAGNSTNASVTGLRIDRTPPNTTASVPTPDFNGWYVGATKVTLPSFDGLSGVDQTFYSVDGGTPAAYSLPFSFGDGGVHTIRFWSVDAAGNVEPHADAAHLITLKIDDINPSIAGTRTPDANGFGWNNGSVLVSFLCSDSETGVDPVDCPAPSTLASEGAAQSVTGTTHDRAGNSASATVDHINIDLTPPSLTGTATTAPNASGWYRNDVAVHWTAVDALSGVDTATVPADSVVTGEGSNLSTPVVHVYDKAGNQGDGSLSGIKIDRTAPSTTAAVPTDPAVLKNGWYTGPVTVSLLASDTLSGVDATYYSIDGGEAATYDGSFQLTSGGIHQITFWSADRAGNVEDKTAAANSITVKIDNIAPSIHGSRKTGSEANTFGWNNGPVGVQFACGDGETGVASCAADATVTGEGADQNVQGVATDFAGNSASDTVDGINIDLTKPTLTGDATTSPNAAGWYRGDVTIHWTPLDALSGIDPATAPTDSTITGEGADLGAGPVTVKDKAGNESAPASVSGVHIDRTAPTITGAPTTTPNGNGWYTSAVKVDYSCNDTLSGVATCPTEQVLSANGADQGTTSAPAYDNAGNKADGFHVGGINIDGLAPQTTAELQCDGSNGYCRGATATVNLTASDQAGLSGVASIHYSVDGGAEHVVNGATASVDLPLSGSGTATIAYYAVDKADNAESGNSSTVKWDNIAPTVTHTLNPNANASGWDNADTTVHFDATDDFSGVDLASITPNFLVATETDGFDVVGTAKDVAGNTGTDTAHVKLDKTAPTVHGARQAGSAANAFGWNNGDVAVQFTCGDSLSGVAVCPDPVTLSGEGADQSITRTAKDRADNTASETVTGISIDKTKPELAGAAATPPNANGWYKGDVTIHWTSSDALSGIDPATVPSDATILGEGDDLSASASVSDKAGNSQSASVTGIKIDRADPNTTITVPDPLPSGWYADKLDVVLTATDALSGVDKTYYAVDGGEPKAYTGVFSYDARGTHTLTYWSVDNAGNVEAKGSKVLEIDDVPPVITGSSSPAPTGYGWNNSDVTVHFVCSDAESGILDCSGNQTLQNEGPNQSAVGMAIDKANNTSSTTVSGINIDKTKPTLVGFATAPPNAAGWYNGDVTVDWTAGDGLSGIDPTTVPAPATIIGEGMGLGTPVVHVQDKAGNSQSASYGGVNIDRTAPTITPSRPAPNSAGWYRSAVTVTYACADALSGVASCPDAQTLGGDGAGQSVTSSTAADKAGNVATGVQSGGINIDSKAPQSSANQSCGTGNNWCQSTATVNIAATDQPGLSGVKAIHYTVDGGAEHTVDGDSAAVNLTLSATGTASVRYWAVDNAGNAEPENGVSIKYDNIAPTVTHALSPAANAASWNNASTTVHFTATDDAGGSGVDPATVTPDQVIAAETAGSVVTGQAYDYARNLGTDSVTVQLDRTAPTIAAAATTQPNANGWYSGPVTVHFTCSDALSGIATCPSNQMLTTDGSAQIVSGTAYDIAGNPASAAVTGINIDTVAPVISFTGVAGGGLYTLGGVPQAGCTATDAGSGLAAPCSAKVTGGLTNGVGTYTVTGTAADRAGNSTTQSITYRVTYRWDGFLQPINDTAHQVGVSTSIFKGNSTVPTKFQLKNAAGTVIQATTTPQWLVPAKGCATSAPVDESAYSDVATSGGSYSWDGTGQQYQYNWSTKGFASGFYYRIGVKLDDGQVYDVNIGLR